jgi:hypothetical protein
MNLDHHMRNPNEPLDVDSVQAIGLDGTGFDGSPRFPYTWASLTDDERTRMHAHSSGAAETD